MVKITNKQVKIIIKDKDYYCDMEVLKLIERLQDKIELLEYNRDKAIEYIENTYKDYKNEDNSLPMTLHDQELLSILRGESDEK